MDSKAAGDSPVKSDLPLGVKRRVAGPRGLGSELPSIALVGSPAPPLNAISSAPKAPPARSGYPLAVRVDARGHAGELAHVVLDGRAIGGCRVRVWQSVIAGAVRLCVRCRRRLRDPSTSYRLSHAQPASYHAPARCFVCQRRHATATIAGAPICERCNGGDA